MLTKKKRGKKTRSPFLGTRVLHTKKQKRWKNKAEPIFGKSMSRATSIFAVWSKQWRKTYCFWKSVKSPKKQKRGKKRGAHFWEVDVQSDLDFRRLVKTMKKNVLFLKKRKIAPKKQKRGKKRGANFGELDFCIPKNNNAEKKRGAQVGVLRVIFF